MSADNVCVERGKTMKRSLLKESRKGILDKKEKKEEMDQNEKNQEVRNSSFSTEFVEFSSSEVRVV